MFLLMIALTHAIVLMFSSSICCKREEDDDSIIEESDEQQARPQDGSPDAAPDFSLEMGSKGGKAAPLEMSAENPQVRFVLQFQGEPTEEFVNNVAGVANSAGVYLWSSKKRATAITAAWKDLVKRISTLQTEGFDVLAGSDEAKELRKIESQRQLRHPLLEKLEPKKVVKKKKKKKKKVGEVINKKDG